MACKMNCVSTALSLVISGHRVHWLINARCVRSYTTLCCMVRLTLTLRPKQNKLINKLIKAAKQRRMYHLRNRENIIHMSRIWTPITRSRLSLWPARSKSVASRAMWQTQEPFLCPLHQQISHLSARLRSLPDCCQHEPSVYLWVTWVINDSFSWFPLGVRRTCTWFNILLIFSSCTYRIVCSPSKSSPSSIRSRTE